MWFKNYLGIYEPKIGAHIRVYVWKLFRLVFDIWILVKNHKKSVSLGFVLSFSFDHIRGGVSITLWLIDLVSWLELDLCSEEH